MPEPVRDWTDLARASVTAALKHLFPDEHFITRQRDVERARGRAFMYRQAHRLRKARQQGRSLGTQVSLENHYSSLRERERAKRTALAYAADALRQTSPLGAYWVLNPYKKEHCKLCLFMAGKNWSWPVLDVISPMRTHPGCGCHLISWMPSEAHGTARSAKRYIRQLQAVDVAQAKRTRREETSPGPLPRPPTIPQPLAEARHRRLRRVVFREADAVVAGLLRELR